MIRRIFRISSIVLALASSATLHAEIVEQNIVVDGAKIFYLEWQAPEEAPVVLLLHGARFSSDTWRRLDTLSMFGAAGYRVLALDLPGYGRSRASDTPREDFLAGFLDAMAIDRVSVVSPSMSGAFSLPLLVRHPERIFAYVPVAPGAIDEYIDELDGVRVPTLVVWGENDAVIPVDQAHRLSSAIADSTKLIMKDASHPCYLDDPELFHSRVLSFLEQAKK